MVRTAIDKTRSQYVNKTAFTRQNIYHFFLAEIFLLFAAGVVAVLHAQ